jgi:ABC-type multidrug transport system fused ATPase/permease subunit
MDARIALTWQQSLFSLGVAHHDRRHGSRARGRGLHVMRRQMTIGDLTIVIAYPGRQYGPLSAIAHTTGQLQGALAGAKRVRAMLALVLKRPTPRRRQSTPLPSRATSGLRTSGSMPDGTDVLHDITFDANPGEMVALVGLTGAGKTTLVSLIPRFYDVRRACAPRRARCPAIQCRLLRGTSPLSSRTPCSLPERLPTTFDTGASTPPEEIVEAARAAHAHDFISRLPKGYDTDIAEAGASLSGGERQRLSVRAPSSRTRPSSSSTSHLVARRHLRGNRVRRAQAAPRRPNDHRDRPPVVDGS